jgi:hypothetical protein
MFRIISVVVPALALALPAMARPSHGGGGHSSPSAPHHSPSFPSSPSAPPHHVPSNPGRTPSSPGHIPTNPSHPVPRNPGHVPSAPGRVPPHPSPVYRRPSTPLPRHNGNIVTPGHASRIEHSNERSRTVMRSNPRVNVFVGPHVNVYTHTYRPIFVQRYNVYNGYYGHYSSYYRPWYRYGFYGGFYYPLVPVYDIHEHFYNPMVFWFYGDSWDDNYYSTWYGSDYYSYPDLQRRFMRPGVFYPTVAMRDLALGVSSMPAREQSAFRVGMNDLVSKLDAKMFPARIDRNEIVVSHYQMLESAVVLEGFVSPDSRQFPFKALLDLNDPQMNLLFVPVAGEVDDSQLYELRMLNERIEHLGGYVETDTTSAVEAPASIPAEPAPYRTDNGRPNHQGH